MTRTTNLNLKKPEYTDYADVADFNDNFDTLDAAVAAKGDVKTVNGRSGAVTLSAEDVGIYYGSTAPSNPSTGTIWLQPA